MAVKWTDEQQRVIDHRRGNLLVSAAAGSGKTAVLVAHVIDRILDPDNPLDISRLLLVTFTEAAAAEMRDRLIRAIEDALDKQPENDRLASQASLAAQAHIQTIDSFCMWLVRNHFHELDIDPDFRIAEEGEGKLMRADVLDELLEERYEEGSEEFLAFIDRYAGSRDDAAAGELIENLYHFSQSAPDPEAWLDGCLSSLDIDAPQSLDDYPWSRTIREELARRIEGLCGTITAARDVTVREACLESITALLENDARKMREAASAGSLTQMISLIREMKFARWSTRKIHAEAPEVKDFAKRVRDAVKDQWKALAGAFAFTGTEEMLEVLAESASPIRVLTALTKEFSARYAKAKKEKNLADFSDVEHWALALVRQKDGTPSALAREISLQFDEIAVDEYQDSNLIQEQILTAVSGEERGCPNLFMVGDVKQSIYKFRMARPELFMEKYDLYPSEEGGDRRKIELSRNFRTRASVLDVINHVFFRVMKRRLGGVEYTADCALYPGAQYPELPAGHEEPSVELQLCVCPQNADKAEAEARAVAERIRRLTDPETGLRLWDAGKETYRVARYRDIAVLLRRMKGSAGIFEETLRGCGIPAVAQTRTGYFDAIEVQVMLNALALIDNPMQDIPLASVLLSPMGSFSEEDLALVSSWWRRHKAEYVSGGASSLEDGAEAYAVNHGSSQTVLPGGDLYAALQQYTLSGENDALSGAIARFLRELDHLRDFAVHHTIYDLIGEILTRTGYDLYLSALPAGTVRRLNVEMLRQKAADFEKTSYHGIFQFNRYIEKIRQYEVDYGEAQTESEEEDVVRILSIHKSKGLEYPVVFLCDTDRGFDGRDTTRPVIFQDDLGAAADFVDLEHSQKRKSLWKAIVADRIRRDARGEELRVLYVAMTRAKEKLILSAPLKESSTKGEEELIAGIREKTAKAEEISRLDPHGEIPGWYIAGAKSFLDWLLMAFADAPGLAPLTIYRKEDAKAQETVRQIEGSAIQAALDAVPPASADVVTSWEERMDTNYAHADAAAMKAVWSVSELKEEEYQPIHEGKEEEKVVIGGAARGTAYHRVLQFMPPTVDADMARVWITANLPRGQAEMVNPEDIAAFYRSPSGSLCLKQGVKRHMEQPFVFGVPKTEFETLKKDGFAGWRSVELTSEEDEDLILIQGIIDLYLEEEDGITLIDYKTDAASPDRLRELYSVQLRCYAMALRRITGKPIKHIWIYSFYHHREVEIP